MKPLVMTMTELNIENYLRFRDRIIAMLDQNLYPIEWLDGRIARDEVHVLVDGDSCLLIERREFPSGAAEVHATVAVGDMHAIAGPLKDRAEEIGRLTGRVIASVESRMGWAKALPEYHVYQVTLRKVL